MKQTKLLFSLALALLIGHTAQAEEEKSSSSSTTPNAGVAQPAAATDEGVDEEWLNTIWTQVDDMVKEEEFKLQETVTVAGVRGAEAEDGVLDKLYYKGAKRYPSQDKLRKAIDTLKEAIAKNPKSAGAPKQKFFVAQCYQKLGQKRQARDFYTQVTKDHAKTPWADKATKALAELAAAEARPAVQ